MLLKDIGILYWIHLPAPDAHVNSLYIVNLKMLNSEIKKKIFGKYSVSANYYYFF